VSIAVEQSVIRSLHCVSKNDTNYSAANRGAEYCDDHVCLSVSVCLFASISLEVHIQSSACLVQVTCSRGAVLLWRRCDTLCISGFIDDVIFARKPRLLDVAPELAPERSLGLGYKRCTVIPATCQRTLGPTFLARKVTPHSPAREQSLWLPCLECYNLDVNQPILRCLGRNVADAGRG